MWRDVRQAPGWPNKLRYVLGRPGWRHDGPARFASPRPGGNERQLTLACFRRFRNFLLDSAPPER